MFDDPKNTLRRMEEELRAAEYEEEEAEPDDGFGYADDSWLEEAKALIGEDEEIPIRNHANGYGARPRNYAMYDNREVYDEELDDAAVLYAQEPRKKKGIGGLVLLALLEVLGILAVLWWWVRWLL